MFYGLDWIATVPPTIKLAATAFGRERAPMVFGWIFAAHQIGAAVAAFGAGLSRTLLLTYTPALYARSEEHTSELQSLMRISYAVLCLKQKKNQPTLPCQT